MNDCIIAWGGAVLQSIIVTQKYILKIILNKNKMYPTHLLFNDSKVLQINRIYIKSALRFASKNKNYIKIISHQIPTRQAQNGCAIIPTVKLSKCQKSLDYTISKIYNILPEEFRNKSYNRIKNKIH